MGHLQMKMVKTVEVNTYGAWGIPVEAVREIRSKIRMLLQAAESPERSPGGWKVEEEETALWGVHFEQRNPGILAPWKLVFYRLMCVPTSMSALNTEPS